MKKFRYKIEHFVYPYPLGSEILVQKRILKMFWITIKTYDYPTEVNKAIDLLKTLNKQKHGIFNYNNV